MNWTELTDEDRDAAFNRMPDMLDGFMKLWGWLHFAKAIEQTVQEKNAHLLAVNAELLEALQRVSFTLSARDNEGEPTFMPQVRAALSKATGG